MILNTRKQTGQARSGFTLVEVALAIVIVALGILAVFGLLSAGLDQSAKAIAETEAAIFADNVFHGLGAISLSLAETPTVATNIVRPWEDFWVDAIDSDGIDIPVTAPDAWKGYNTANELVVNTDGNIHTNEYVTLAPTFRASNIEIESRFMRYRLNVTLRDAVANPPGTGGLWTNRAMCTLTVWRGRFGSLDEPMVFYEEFTNPGDL